MKALATGEVSFDQIRSCFGKKEYFTEQKADAAIRLLRERGLNKNKTIHAYPCEYCGMYHVGHYEQ
jgi:hypothetical protein